MNAKRAPLKASNQATCIACGRLLPHLSFRQDAAGRLTAWCEECRGAAAKRWGIEPDHVEAAYALYVAEQTWKAEAIAGVRIRIQVGAVPATEEAALQDRISVLDGARFTRIPERIGRFLAAARADWMQGCGLASEGNGLAREAGGAHRLGRSENGSGQAGSVPDSWVRGEAGIQGAVVPNGLGGSSGTDSGEGAGSGAASIRIPGARDRVQDGRQCREQAPGAGFQDKVPEKPTRSADGLRGRGWIRDGKMAAAGRDP